VQLARMISPAQPLIDAGKAALKCVGGDRRQQTARREGDLEAVCGRSGCAVQPRRGEVSRIEGRRSVDSVKETPPSSIEVG
jgi:hypothetical protein